jgi:hypothetical protein
MLVSLSSPRYCEIAATVRSASVEYVTMTLPVPSLNAAGSKTPISTVVSAATTTARSVFAAVLHAEDRLAVVREGVAAVTRGHEGLDETGAHDLLDRQSRHLDLRTSSASGGGRLVQLSTPEVVIS